MIGQNYFKLMPYSNKMPRTRIATVIYNKDYIIYYKSISSFTNILFFIDVFFTKFRDK